MVAGDAFAAYRAGDQSRMGDLVRAVTPILWHTVRAYRLDTPAAEDVLQSTWVALVRRADSIHDPRAVLQWLIVTARREAWRVSSEQRRTEPTEWVGDELVAPSVEQPEARTVQGTQDSALWQNVNQLPERCRQLLRVIAFADQPDYAQIARSLAMPVGSIGPTRGRCLAKLRLLLAADSRWEQS
ncbi:MAG: sigma-70 family RNA polymerase sigma factor [Actinomycetota bacterium]|nr:sigma-70 family RNA polymerase sigma factor [Actinomycetota bacterium]